VVINGVMLHRHEVLKPALVVSRVELTSLTRRCEIREDLDSKCCRGYLGNLFELSDVHVIVRGPPCRYLLGAIEPLRFFSIEPFIYIFRQPS